MSPIRLIAETAWHHQGEIDFMKKLVNEISSNSNADIVKFHISLDIDEYMSTSHPLYSKMLNWMFDENQWTQIIDIPNSKNKNLMLLFNDIRSIEFGMKFNPTLVEIHSVCLNDLNLLTALKHNINPNMIVALGIGGSDLYEIENALTILNTQNVVLVFGFQNYPTKLEDINFNKIRKIMKLFPEFRFAYADHTAWDSPHNELITLLGAALGMDYIEKHVTIAYGEDRIDYSAAISIEMFNNLREQLKVLDACNGDGLLKLNMAETNYSVYGPMKKAAILKSDVKAPSKLSEEMLVFKRTKEIADISQLETCNMIGKEVLVDIDAGDLLSISHFKKS